jgi:PAS domain S-box-containing protein
MNKSLRVLLIEDDAVDAMSLVRAAAANAWPYLIDRAMTVADARRALAAHSYDVILADYKLGDGTAFDLMPLLLDKLVIFTTGSGDEATAAEAMRRGVRDLQLLPHRVEVALRQWRSEQLLRENEERHRDFIQNATDLIQIVDANGLIQFVNRAWLGTLGYTEAEVVGRSIFEFVAPLCRERCMELFRGVLQAEAVNGLQTVFLARDGREIQVEGNVNCRLELGQPATTRGIFRDITQRRKHEEERERLITELRAALDEVKTLSGLLPICAWCKKIRNDQGYWQSVEAYLQRHVKLTHGICPECQTTFMVKLDNLPEQPPPA